jgi:hypothetical protein
VKVVGGAFDIYSLVIAGWGTPTDNKYEGKCSKITGGPLDSMFP